MELQDLITKLAQLAFDDASEKGWSLRVAQDDHIDQLLTEFSAKNMADVLWIAAAVEMQAAQSPSPEPAALNGGSTWMAGIMRSADERALTSPLMMGVKLRLRELITRLETTGSLLRQ